MKPLLSPLREIVILLWPLGAAALLTELGYLVHWPPLPVWAALGLIVGLPLVAGVVLVYRLLARFGQFRLVLTVMYGVLALFALPYVALMVAAAHGDAL